MKKALMVLLLVTIIISCRQGSPNDPQPKDAAHNHSGKEEVPGIESVLIPLSRADSMIKAYHRFVDFGHNNNQHVSFELNADALRNYLMVKQDIRKLDVYLAMNDTGITLVYIGAKDSAGIPVEVPYTRPGDTTEYMMDNVFPCPTCPRLSIYQQSESQQNQ